jgi:diadenosine tetraphosphate (Ap4A) HIT family hydrolase
MRVHCSTVVQVFNKTQYNDNKQNYYQNSYLPELQETQQHLTNHRSYIPKKHSQKMADLSENLWLLHIHTHQQIKKQMAYLKINYILNISVACTQE